MKGKMHFFPKNPSMLFSLEPSLAIPVYTLPVAQSSSWRSYVRWPCSNEKDSSGGHLNFIF